MHLSLCPLGPSVASSVTPELHLPSLQALTASYPGGQPLPWPQVMWTKALGSFPQRKGFRLPSAGFFLLWWRLCRCAEVKLEGSRVSSRLLLPPGSLPAWPSVEHACPSGGGELGSGHAGSQGSFPSLHAASPCEEAALCLDLCGSGRTQTCELWLLMTPVCSETPLLSTRLLGTCIAPGRARPGSQEEGRGRAVMRAQTMFRGLGRFHRAWMPT